MKLFIVYIAITSIFSIISYFLWDEAWVSAHSNILMVGMLLYGLFWHFIGIPLLKKFVDRFL